jgi:catechol 2,3-dioxygenase-like lactoylglutathione lyase family enzyme
MGDYIISGIQQVGIGVPDVHAAFSWYNKILGMDIPVFEEAAEANLMLPYTGGKPHQRHAILAINMKGGGGFEIWQYTSRQPQPPLFKPQLGDLGLFCARIKTDNIASTHRHMQENKVTILGPVSENPEGKKHFFIEDPYGNLFDIAEDNNFYARGRKHTGGPNGMIIGVSDLERSIKFYSEILGYDRVVSKTEDTFPDLSVAPGGNRKLKRAILTHSQPRKGPFSELLGQTYLELIEGPSEGRHKIFENRLWGDLGYIHLCFDIKNMTALGNKAKAAGHPFTIDGGAGFEMGEATGHFTYIEDPDGTLIEFVETKKVPIMKKMGWYLDLRKRDPERPLPKWMLKAMRFSRKNP